MSKGRRKVRPTVTDKMQASDIEQENPSMPDMRLDKPLLLNFHPKAIARLAQGTAIAVATLLAIPDAIALIPSAQSLVSWALRLLKVWLVALILWFVGFQFILHTVRLVAGGVSVGNDGIRLWRFGKLVAWEQVKAAGVETQHVFSRLFCLKPEARRLTIYVEKRPGSRLSPQYIASFFYQPEDFDKLFATICEGRFGFRPDDAAALVCPASALPELRQVTRTLRWQRALISVVIGIGLTLFLGRKAAVHYVYARANQSFARQDFQQARESYQRATALDPAFAAAWLNLGNAEFKLGNREKAQQYWEKALALKPDMVEPKIGLSYLYTHQRDFTSAQAMLDRALRLAPRDPSALVNLADLNMRLGHTREAMAKARMALTQDSGNHLATCLLAQGQLRLGRPEKAVELIADPDKPHWPKSNNTFCRLVLGEAFLALGKPAQAAALFESILQSAPNNTDALLNLGRARIGQQRFQEADDLLYRASRLSPNNPWPPLARGELQLQLKDPAFADKLLRQAVAKEPQDARSLAVAGRLALKLGQKEKAIQLARAAMRIEPDTPEALAVLKGAGEPVQGNRP